MDLPVLPPVAPMLATLARDLPRGAGWTYEPKWDGFRCIATRAGDDVDLRSRNDRPLARYFPELVEALCALDQSRFVLDGEILVHAAGRPDFSALLARLHPAASRVDRLRRETPASYVAFDVIALGDEDLVGRRFADRRAALQRLFAGAAPPLHMTPSTADPAEAEVWLDGHPGIDGVMAKPAGLRYQPGKRAMVKVKRDRTADCVVAGFRWHREQQAVGSLLLGLYDDGDLRHVGVASSFTAARRRELFADVDPHRVPLEGHPWERGFGLEASPVGRLPGAVSRWQPGHPLSWVPLAPDLVCEVAYDHLHGDRFRHAPRFRHWRPDRDPRSCTYDQFQVVARA